MLTTMHPRALAKQLLPALLAVFLALAPSHWAGAQTGTGPNSTAPGTVSGQTLEVAEDAAPMGAEARGSAQPSLASYPEWERLAGRAERVLEAGRASDGTLEQLRSELAGWRSQFEDNQSVNTARLEALRAQITALGPVPEGTVEAPELALRRSELEEQLARLEAPQRAAEEAYSRAESLIRQIDALLRERKASALLRLGPTPLNPVYWGTAWREVSKSLSNLGRETAFAWQSEARRDALRNSLPIIFALLVVAFIALRRLPQLLGHLAAQLTKGRSQEFGRVVDFLKSVLRLASVIGSLWLVKQAVIRADMLGYRGQLLVENLWYLALVLAVSGWLGSRTFPRGAPTYSFFQLPPNRMAEGRGLTLVLGLAVWGLWLTVSLTELEYWSQTTQAVLQLPVLIVGGAALFRLGQLIASRPAAEDQPATGQAEFRNGLTLSVGRITSVLGALGPVLGAVGYMAAANYLTVPTALTLALIGGLVLAQWFITDLWGVLTDQKGPKLDAALAPVLIGILLTAAALPLMALIWGARVADLSELWLQLRSGFSLGGTRISAGMFFSFLFVFGIGYGVTRLVQGTLRSTVLPKTSIDPGGQTALVSGVGYLGIVLAALFAITAAGMDLSSLAVVFGALSVGIGFGLQNIVQNFVSGIIMLVERPVAVGDWIEVGGNQGIVREISVRSTRIETFDKTSVIVPNANFISGTVTNWTRASLNGRITVPVTVTYAADSRRVEAILREIVEAHPLVMLNPKPSVTLENFGPAGAEFSVKAILPNINFGGSVRSELRHAILNRFIEEKIAMPGFPVTPVVNSLDKLAQALIPVAAEGGPAAAASALAGAASSVAAENAVQDSAQAQEASDAPSVAPAATQASAAAKPADVINPEAKAPAPAAPIGGYGPADDEDDADDTDRPVPR